MSHRLLILNPGSTSTKAAVYDGEHQTAMKSIVHTNQDLAPYPSLYDQLDYRVALVRGWLAQAGAASSPTSWPAAIWWMTTWPTACGTTRCSTTPPTWAG